MRTSEPIGTKPQARNARSDAALPGATWAQQRSPGGSAARPARISRRPWPAPPAVGSSSSTDSSRRPTRPRPTTTRPASSPYTSTSRAVARGPPDPRVVGEVVAARRAVGPGRGRGRRARRRGCRRDRPGRPASAARRACSPRRYPSAPSDRSSSRIDIGEHVGVPGERHDRPPARPGRAGAPRPTPSAGGNRPAAAASSTAASGCSRQPSTRSRYGLANVRSGSSLSRAAWKSAHCG